MVFFFQNIVWLCFTSHTDRAQEERIGRKKRTISKKSCITIIPLLLFCHFFLPYNLLGFCLSHKYRRRWQSFGRGNNGHTLPEPISSFVQVQYSTVQYKLRTIHSCGNNIAIQQVHPRFVCVCVPQWECRSNRIVAVEGRDDRKLSYQSLFFYYMRHTTYYIRHTTYDTHTHTHTHTTHDVVITTPPHVSIYFHLSFDCTATNIRYSFDTVTTTQ